MRSIFNLVKKFNSKVKTSITVKLPFVNVTLAPTIITSVFNLEGGFFVSPRITSLFFLRSFSYLILPIKLKCRSFK